MSDEFDPTPPELQALHAAIRPDGQRSPDARVRLRARLDAKARANTHVAPEGAPLPRPGVSPRVALGAGMFLVGAAVGAALMSLWPRAPVVLRVTPPPPVTRAASPLLPSPSAAARAAPPAVVAHALAAPAAVYAPPPVPRAASRGGDAGRGDPDPSGDSWRAREQLDVIEDALRERHPEVARALLTRHERDFPRLGATLAQLREALTIRALADLGHRDEADERARRFLASHPRSPYRVLVEAAVGGAR